MLDNTFIYSLFVMNKITFFEEYYKKLINNYERSS